MLSKQKQQKRLKGLIGSGKPVNFSTNFMNSRGIVYTCVINNQSEAIIQSSQTWWGRNYSQPNSTRKGEKLGKVFIGICNGVLAYQLKVRISEFCCYLEGKG